MILAPVFETLAGGTDGLFYLLRTAPFIRLPGAVEDACTFGDGANLL